MKTNEFITVEEAKNILHISEVSQWRLRKKGLLPYIKYGKKVLYKKSDLLDFLNDNYFNENV